MANSTNKPVKIGLVGLGKIAVDQHIPAIRANPNLELVAGCSPHARPEGVVGYSDMQAMLAAHPEIEALAICTPPQVRHRIAKEALAAGRHVFLEKPPAATLGEAEALRDFAAERGVTLLASWHSRFAPAVGATRDWIAQRALKSIHVVWKENVRQWHPGQAWIFAPGGMGVFDPGINALSILTRIVGDTVVVKKADLHIPVNCDAPIEVGMDMVTEGGVPVRADFDFLQENLQTWSIFVEAEDGGKLALSMGGTILEIDGKPVMQEPEREYPGLYAHFHELIASGASDADFSPLRIVADAFMLGKRIAAPAYVE
ncbi:Gfo/Idh/MocA family protein [Pseudoduganella namucuonensis]|uniref:L-arabinose 1-dehydrogenase (NADP+) n=1 Tax=Pseudoduganella namucuonensis TaxID=1035707 RepID=A0A1I7GZA1_9BURK|nr:Gfo/Idh/MocA family oxidoreductase [Pseudoduganella namucuonensis]SFU53755.1 L-arabinose 1-dehydrogenase (NADP+) [Pseudoduganella namucuonensis]